jgi:hypothetical protein
MAVRETTFGIDSLLQIMKGILHELDQKHVANRFPLNANRLCLGCQSIIQRRSGHQPDGCMYIMFPCCNMARPFPSIPDTSDNATWMGFVASLVHSYQTCHESAETCRLVEYSCSWPKSPTIRVCLSTRLVGSSCPKDARLARPVGSHSIQLIVEPWATSSVVHCRNSQSPSLVDRHRIHRRHPGTKPFPEPSGWMTCYRCCAFPNPCQSFPRQVRWLAPPHSIRVVTFESAMLVTNDCPAAA